jgi:hypothetical protein
MSQGEPGIELDTSLGYLLKAAASALHSALEAVLRPLGMTITHYACLELLAQRPGLSNSELARGRRQLTAASAAVRRVEHDMLASPECQRARSDAAPAHRLHRRTDRTTRTSDITPPEFTTLGRGLPGHLQAAEQVAQCLGEVSRAARPWPARATVVMDTVPLLAGRHKITGPPARFQPEEREDQLAPLDARR